MSQKKECSFRIKNANGTYYNAGTDFPSWFTKEEALLLVDRSIGQKVVENDGVYDLWEIL